MFEHLAEGQIDRDMFTPQLAGMVSAQMKTGLAKFLRDVGKLEAIQLVERKNEGADRLYRYRLVFKRQNWILPCTFDKNNKLTSLTLGPE